jgi:hypothetical protein
MESPVTLGTWMIHVPTKINGFSVLSENLDHFDPLERPQSALAGATWLTRPLGVWDTLDFFPATDNGVVGPVLCRERQGGLLKHYYRQAV